MAYQSIFSGGKLAPNLKTSFNFTPPPPPKFDVNQAKDVPTLNAALHSGLINQAQWMNRFKQIQPNAKGFSAPQSPTPKIQTGFLQNLNPFDSQSVVNQQEVTPVKNTFVGAYQKAVSQAKYLAGPTPTQAQRDTLINNQKAVQNNPVLASAINKSAKTSSGPLSKGNSAQALIKAEQMARQGTPSKQIQTFLAKDRQALAGQTGKGLVTAATIAGFSAPGEGIFAKSLGAAADKTGVATILGKNAATNATTGKLADTIRAAQAKTTIGEVPKPKSAFDNHVSLTETNSSPALSGEAPKTPATSIEKPLTEGQGSGKSTPVTTPVSAVGKNVGGEKPKLTTLYHGTSSDVNLDNLKAGNTTGLERGQNRRLIYASDNPDVAREYAAGRGTSAGNGSPNVVQFNFGGRILDQTMNNKNYLNEIKGLIDNPDFNNLSARSRNQLTNVYQGGHGGGILDGGILETNPELTNYIKNHGYDAVKWHHQPFGGKLDVTSSNQTAILNPNKILRANEGAVGKNVVSNADVAKAPEKIAYDVPAYTKEVQQTLNNTTKATRAGDTGGALKEIQSIFTPGTGKEAAAVKNDFRAATGNLALNRTAQAQSLHDTAKFFERQKPGDNLNFIQRFESGIKQPTPQLEQHAATFKDWFGKDLGLARQIKPDTPELQNYFSHSGIWENPQAAKSFYNKFVTQSLGGKPSALEERHFPTIYDGIKAGLVPKETNPATLALNNRAQLLKAKMAQDFVAEQTKKGVDPELVQKIVDRYLQPSLNRSAVYRTVKQAAYGLNNLQLGFSGFHVAGTGINAAVSRFANGVEDVLRLHPVKGTYKIVTSPTAPIKYIFQGSKMIKDVRSGKLSQDVLNVAEGGGRVDRQLTYQTQGISKSINQLKSGDAKNIVKGAGMLPFRAISTSAKPVMEWWVPRIKAGATKELIDRKVAELGPNATQAELRAAKAEAINSIDNRFGQLVQDNLFWNKPTKDMMSILMRSPGWNIGTVRELGGGAANLARPSVLKGLATGKGVPESTAYTASLAATVMMIGTAMNYMFTGKPPSSPLDYFYPKTGKTDKNGNAERVSLPTYAKDVFAFSHNPAQTVKNKANPIIQLGGSLKSNTDYFGNEIRNPKDSGKKQLQQTGSYIAKNVLPFTVTNSAQRVDKSKGTKAQSFFGITPAPGYITKSTFQQKVEAALNQALGTKRQTPEQVQLSNQKSKARQDVAKGDPTLLNQLVKSKQITPKQAQTLQRTANETALARTFNYLESVDKKTAQQLYKTATPADKKKLGKINVQKLMK